MDGPGSGLAVRAPASGAELEACAELMAASEPWVTLRRTAAASLTILRDTAKEVWIGLVDREFAGFMILDLRGPLCGYIQTVCIRPDLRGRGVGTAFLAWAEERIRGESPNVFLCVSSFNQGARRLYERLGYRVVGPLTDFIVEGHDEILMRKTRGSWNAYRAAAEGDPQISRPQERPGDSSGPSTREAHE